MATEARKKQTIYMSTAQSKFYELLREALPDANVVFFQSSGYKMEVKVPYFDENPSILSDIELLFTTPYILAKYAEKLVNLKWINSPANGADALMKNNFHLKYRDKFIFTKLHGSVNAPNTTEYVIGQIIARERNFLDIKEEQRNKNWNSLREKNSYRNLSQLTIGIMGLGAIGDYMARQCKSLGMSVWGLTRNRRSQSERALYIDEYRTQEKLGEFLENCDYICNILPSTGETVNMLSGDVFKYCSKKRGVFINVGRGDIADEQSIVRAIENKWLGGAILDCFDREPLPEDSRLWTLPGVTCTPHISGWSLSTHRANVIEQYVENYRRYEQNQPLLNVFDWDKGY